MIAISFSYNGESEDELGITPSTIEEYIGNNPVPLYLGQKYEKKLTPRLTFMKDPCFSEDVIFSEKELRSIIRVITGNKGYQWLKVINTDIDEDLWYRVIVNNISYKRIGGHITGLIIDMECDSAFAWSKQNIVTINVKSGKKFYIYNNTDDLNSYVLPFIEIISNNPGIISITNISDNNWISQIKNVRANEKISIDSQREIITSSIEHNLLLNDFNLHWIRLVPDKNEYISDTDLTITFKYRVPRKVGFTE